MLVQLEKNFGSIDRVLSSVDNGADQGQCGEVGEEV